MGSTLWCSFMYIPFSLPVESKVLKKIKYAPNSEVAGTVPVHGTISWKSILIDRSSELEFLPVYHPSEKERADPQVNLTIKHHRLEVNPVFRCLPTMFVPWWHRNCKSHSALSLLPRQKSSLAKRNHFRFKTCAWIDHIQRSVFIVVSLWKPTKKCNIIVQTWGEGDFRSKSLYCRKGAVKPWIRFNKI